MNKEDIRRLALQYHIEVRFTTTSGTERKMRCTLRKEELPYDEGGVQLIVDHVRKENPNILAVWDLDKQQWRSFRINSLLEEPKILDV